MAGKKRADNTTINVKGKKVKNTWKTVTVANKTTGKKNDIQILFFQHRKGL